MEASLPLEKLKPAPRGRVGIFFRAKYWYLRKGLCRAAAAFLLCHLSLLRPWPSTCPSSLRFLSPSYFLLRCLRSLCRDHLGLLCYHARSYYSFFYYNTPYFPLRILLPTCYIPYALCPPDLSSICLCKFDVVVSATLTAYGETLSLPYSTFRGSATDPLPSTNYLAPSPPRPLCR